jgi:hypothetical protein
VTRWREPWAPSGESEAGTPPPPCQPSDPIDAHPKIFDSELSDSKVQLKDTSMNDTPYIAATPHLRDSLQHDLTTIRTDVSPTVVTSDASGFAAVMIFSNDPKEIHNRFVESYRAFQMVSADANNDASSRVAKIVARERELEIREREVAELKLLLEHRMQAIQAIVAVAPTA